MRIGILTTSFPRYEGDVAGCFVLGFARALATLGHQIEVLAPEPNVGATAPRWPSVEVEWVPYMRPRRLSRTFYGAGAPDNLGRDPLAWLGVAPFVGNLVRHARARSRGWDAVASHWALPCAVAAGLTGSAIPHLAVVHSADLHALRSLPLGRRMARQVARSASNLLFVSTMHRDEFLKLLPALLRTDVAGRCHVSPMGIEPPGTPSQPRRALRSKLALSGFSALSLGRLVPIKGIDDAIRAVAGNPGVELLIGGEGPERDSLERLAGEVGARARFVGHVTGQEKRDLMAAADAFLAPSRQTSTGRTEGVPTAILEAMAAGLPVIASDTGGIGSVIESGRTGLLTTPGRPDQLRQAIEDVARDRNLRRRLSRAARTTGKHYTWDVLAPHLEALLSPVSR